MIFEYDEAKRVSNLVKHGVDFALVREVDWTIAVTKNEVVNGEARRQTLVLIKGRLHFLSWTQRQDRIRLISLRKANSREAKAYDKAIHSDP